MVKGFSGRGRRVPRKEKPGKKQVGIGKILKKFKKHFRDAPVPKKPLERRIRQSDETRAPKGFQFSREFLKVLAEYPELVTDFLTLKSAANHSTETQRNRYLSVQRFDPNDNSRFHDALYRVRLKGNTFFVKEVRNPATPMDAISQFESHDRVTVLNHQMQPWGARVLEYHAAWKSKQESFLVSDWIQGVPLEQWLSLPQGHKKDEVYQRFLRTERFLTRQKLRDVTTRNTIYNPKTDELVIIDLLPNY